jgi:hypothetical protein
MKQRVLIGFGKSRAYLLIFSLKLQLDIEQIHHEFNLILGTASKFRMFPNTTSLTYYSLSAVSFYHSFKRNKGSKRTWVQLLLLHSF